MDEAVPPSSFDVVIVNWYGWPQLRRCVEHVLAAAAVMKTDGGQDRARIIIMDNSLEAPPTELIDWLEGKADVVRTGRNLGFGTACNRGAALGTAPYILFLNGDAWPDVEALRRLSATMLEEESEGHCYAIHGARMRNAQGDVASSCWRFPSLARLTLEASGLDRLAAFHRFGCRMREFDHSRPALVDQVIGAFLAIRRDAFEAVGGYDERFFLYYEEVDLCLRVSRAGNVVRFNPEIGFTHVTGQMSRTALADRLAYNAHSRIVYGRKHFGVTGAIYIGFLAFTLEPTVRLLLGLFSKRGASPMSSMRYFRRLIRGLRQSGWSRSIPLDIGAKTGSGA